jgi:hypothetical protein
MGCSIPGDHVVVIMTAMKTAFLLCLALMLVNPSLAAAQRAVSIEVTPYAGVPIGPTLKSNICCSTAQFVHHELDRAGYAGGLGAGVVLYDRVRVEFGAIYMPVSFKSVSTADPLTRSRGGASWELPLLATYRWPGKSWRPLTGGGVVVHSKTSGSFTQPAGLAFNWGVEWVRSRLSVRPEMRFIHYAQSSSSTNQDVGRPSFQAQFLVGVSFRVR